MTFDFKADIVRPIEQKKKFNDVQAFVNDVNQSTSHIKQPACHIHHQIISILKESTSRWDEPIRARPNDIIKERAEY
jgi:hypothetical protein